MAYIKLNLAIKTAPGKIYQAITTQDGLAAWWAKQTTARPELGFVNSFTFGTLINEFKVTQLETGRKVEWQCITSIDEWMGTTITFELEEKEGKTLLRFTHGGWKAATDLFAACTYDWGRFMASLKSFCETGTGQPA
jgi:uncharacterized protein YndB with AHSA1/START domain